MLAALAMAGAGITALLLLCGLSVHVTNVGETPLRGLTVHVTGNSYPVGDLAPHKPVSVRVEPQGESNVELSFIDEQGRPRRLKVDCYLEPGYRGRIEVEVTSDRVQKLVPRLRHF